MCKREKQLAHVPTRVWVKKGVLVGLRSVPGSSDWGKFKLNDELQLGACLNGKFCLIKQDKSIL